MDGRARHVTLPAGSDLAALPRGGIVQVGAARERVADRNIAALASNGLYHADLHLARLRASPLRTDPEEIVSGHVRRLEALRRAGVHAVETNFEYATRQHGLYGVRTSGP